MKQKLAIARAVLHEPEVIFLDEPTVGLDPEATREVRAVIAELAAEQRTLVLCTHHLDEVERLCGRAAFVAGRLLAIHDLRAPQHQRLRGVLLAPHAPGLAAARAVPGVLSVQAEEGPGGRALLSIELAEQGAGAEAIAAALVEALSRSGARLCELSPAGDALEAAWLQLQEQARAEGLIAARGAR
jgi:ABC-2 type transport system ATP-binding protein